MKQTQLWIVNSYTELLWEAIKKKSGLYNTDLSASPCAFAEAPAEGIFSISIYERICKGRVPYN